MPKIITAEERRRRRLVLQNLLRQGYSGEDLYRVAKQSLNIGPKKVREIKAQILAKLEKDDELLNNAISVDRDIAQIDETMRRMVRESADVKDSKGVITKKGKDFDTNNYIKLIALRAKLTGTVKAAQDLAEKRTRSNSYLGIKLGDDIAGGEDLVGPEEEKEGGIIQSDEVPDPSA